MQTPQQSAVAAAQRLSVLMTQYIQLMQGVSNWLADYNRNTWDTYWQKLPTAAINQDGTIGAADATPTGTNPINVPAAAPLLMSRNQLITAKALLDTLTTLYGQAGGTVAAPNQSAAQTAALIAPNTV